jgi:hypothetical protein
MRTALIVVFTILLTSLCFSQHLTDTVGTATTYWSKITLNRGTANVLCEVINDGSSTNYILVAKTHQDTVATGSAKYTTRVNNLESILFYTNQAYVYLKSSASTATYRVKTY